MAAEFDHEIGEQVCRSLVTGHEKSPDHLHKFGHGEPVTVFLRQHQPRKQVVRGSGSTLLDQRPQVRLVVDPVGEGSPSRSGS